MGFDPRWSLPPVTLLATSRERGWAGIGAELRRHVPGEVPDMVADSTVIGIALRGNARSVIHRRGNGQAQSTPVATGAIWLCPRGVEEDSIRITGAVPQMLHIYLHRAPFAALAMEDGAAGLDGASISYDSGFQDPLVASLAGAIGAELRAPSSTGRLLVETAGLTLAAWLLHARPAGRRPPAPGARATRPLDPARLARVLDYMEAHIGGAVGLEELAEVACLSPFHFARAFRAATGQPPHRFLAARRLEQACRLLAEGRLSLAEIAHASSFETQSAFTRAFRRATGMAPGRYRRQA